ncbi:MAG TPA: hypothetical protein VEK08_22630 [Planctomycetota bacterium]|nr:hypothetical protein [Planctomycetota bacterium]
MSSLLILICSLALLVFIVRSLLPHLAEDNHRWTALLGSVLIGVILPTFLVCWCSGAKGVLNLIIKTKMNTKGKPLPDLSLDELAGNWSGMLVQALILCGPIAIGLANIVFDKCLERTRKRSTPNQRYAVLLGAAISIFNLPGWGVVMYLPPDGLVLLRTFLLFVVAGSSCGLWISWHAQRSVDSHKPYWPQFSLGTLLIMILSWGALMAIFAPAPSQ